MTELPRAPASLLNSHRQPAFGTFAGYVGLIDWEALAKPLARNRLWTRWHTKRWHYLCVAGPRCVVLITLVDVGWGASAFAVVFDRAAGRIVYHGSSTGPRHAVEISARPGPGARSRFRGRRMTLSMDSSADATQWRIEGACDNVFQISANLDAGGSPAPLCAIVPIEGGIGNCTHKTVGLLASGEVDVGSATFDLDGSLALLDHTYGILARKTAWKWAAASTRDVSLNLVEGLNGPGENFVWIDGKPYPVGAVRFSFDPAAPMKPWTIKGDGGRVDLLFVPEGFLRQDKQLLIAESRWLGPVGKFSGTLHPDGIAPRRVDALLGVTEDHFARW